MRSLRLRAAAMFVLLAMPAIAADEAAPDPALAARGRELFNDASLSGDGKTSCATCHFSTGHTNNKTYVGLDVVADGDPKGRSTPTLWGAGDRSVYAWAGTAPTIEENIRGIIVNRMKGKEPPKETLASLVAYIRTLTPPRDWQMNEDGTPAATASAPVKRGFELFTGDGGCGTCHVLPRFDKADKEDVGTGGAFKVPSLRAVASTAPYFHDGRTASLRDAVKIMWDAHNRKSGGTRSPSDAELDDLVAYLSAL